MAQLKSTVVQGALTVTGNAVASKLIKNGGTSDDILLGDGSTTSKSDIMGLINAAVVLKGTLGAGGTITSLPTAAASNLGHAYKVSVAGTYASQAAKVGDMFICWKSGTDSYAWMYIPSGDDIEDTWREIKLGGTQILANGNTTNALNFIAGTNVGITNSNGSLTFTATDTGATSIETTGTGNAVTSGSYNATTRKITLNKENSFLPLSGGTLTGALGFNNRYLIKPVADFVGGSSSYTGAITITLPAGIGNTMVSMWVDVYNYKTGTSFSAHVGGYTYQNSTWANHPSGMVYGADHKVRLGHNGTNFVIYIGELNSTWSYPQITVRNVLLGHNPSYANWYNNWTVNFTSDSFKSVTATLVDRAWTNRNLNPSNYLTEEKDTLATVTARGAETTTAITANSFIKKDSSNDYILLGGGGTKAVSDFASADVGDDYLPLAGGAMTGAIVRHYTAASTDPVLKIASNNFDINIFKVYSGDQTYKNTGVYGYNLVYNGTGSGAANNLTLNCDNQNAATQVIGWQLNQAGQMGIGTSVNTSYGLTVGGSANATTLYENGTSLANKYAAKDHDHDETYLGKTTYEWNKEYAAGANGAISLGRYKLYDTQITFDITSTTNEAISGKLVIASQNGSIKQARVFGDATGSLVSKLVIYQTAITGNRSWIEVFCNFAGYSKNKVHIYAVRLDDPDVTNQMASVTFTNGVPSPIASGYTKWTGTIVNDILSIENNITGSGTSGYIAKFNGVNTITNGPAFGSDATKFLNSKGEWAVPAGTATGTVTSIGMTVPTGLSVSPASITSSGTFAITYASGYAIPTTTKQTNWDTAYGWGDHSKAGYSKFSGSYNDLTGKPTIPTVNNGTLTMSTSGTGVSGSATFTANQSTASTFTVTLDSSAAGNRGANKVVLAKAAGQIDSDKFTVTSAGIAGVTMEYDSSYKALKFVFN